MTISIGLICVLVALAMVITLLMRPDIFFSVLRGGRESSNSRAKPKIVSEREFQDRLDGGGK